MLPCPSCQSLKVFKNGRIHNGKQNHKCRTCGRQFVANSQQKIISQSTKNLIDKLLLEKISLASIACVCNFYEPWLQNYVNHKYAFVPQEVKVTSKKESLTIQCDEMWSFVKNKGNKQWIWLTLTSTKLGTRDISTREIVGLYVSERSEVGGRKLWHSLPSVYRQCA